METMEMTLAGALLGFLLLFTLFLRNWAASVREEKAVWESEASRWDETRIEREAEAVVSAMELPPPGREGLLILDHLIRRLRLDDDVDPVMTSLRLGAYAALSMVRWRDGALVRTSGRFHVAWIREKETFALDVFLFVYLKMKSVIPNSFERLTDKIELGRPMPL